MKYKKIFHSCIDTKHIINNTDYYQVEPCTPESHCALNQYRQEARFFELYKYYGAYKKEIKKATFLKYVDIKSYLKRFEYDMQKKLLQSATFYKICTGGNCYGYIMITKQFFPADSIYENIVFFN